MKVKSDLHTIRVPGGKGEESKSYAPGKEVDLPDAEAKRLIDRGIAYDPVARKKAEDQAEKEAAAAAEGKPIGGKKPGGGKAD